MTDQHPKKKRKQLYITIEKILGRSVTKQEHEELRSGILEYVESERKQIIYLNQMVQSQGTKIKEYETIYRRHKRCTGSIMVTSEDNN